MNTSNETSLIMKCFLSLNKKPVLCSHTKENMKLKNDMKKKKKKKSSNQLCKEICKKEKYFFFISTEGKIPQVY